MGLGLLGGGLILGFIVRGDSFFARFIYQHTPEVVVQAPSSMGSSPLVDELPVHRFLLWIPGLDLLARRRFLQKYPAIHDVHLERHFSTNRVVVRIGPRIPLVRWNEQGIDREGFIFRLPTGEWNHLPKATFSSIGSRERLGGWFNQLTRVPDLWDNVVGIGEDRRGDMVLEMRSGAQVIWGPADRAQAWEKARYLHGVLKDAHERLGGAAVADLRFFDEGRIILKPKGSEG